MPISSLIAIISGVCCINLSGSIRTELANFNALDLKPPLQAVADASHPDDGTLKAVSDQTNVTSVLDDLRSAPNNVTDAAKAARGVAAKAAKGALQSEVVQFLVGDLWKLLAMIFLVTGLAFGEHLYATSTASVATATSTNNFQDSQQIAQWIKHYVKKDELNTCINTLADINSGWILVAQDAALAICGLIPILGCFPSLYVWYKYSWLRQHLKVHDQQPRWQTQIETIFAIGALVGVHAFCLNAVIERRVMFGRSPMASPSFTIEEMLSMTWLWGMPCVANLIFATIMCTNSVRIRAEVAYYKARAKEALHSRDSCVLLQLENHFGCLFEPAQSPPRGAWELLQEIPGFGDRVLVYSSATCFLVRALLESRPHSNLAAWSIWRNNIMFCIGVVSFFWWMKFMYKLLNYAHQVERNYGQVVLCASLIEAQDFSLWNQRDRDKLRAVFRKKEITLKVADEKLWEHQFRESKLSEDMMVEHDIADKGKWLADPKALLTNQIPDKDLKMLRDLIDEVCFESKGVFDLRKDTESVSAWWEFRRYNAMCFMDVGRVADYTTILSLMLLVCVIAQGFVHTTSFFTQDIRDTDPRLAELQSRCPLFVEIYGRFKAEFAIIVLALTLGFILFRVVDTCVRINQVLQMDSHIVLSSASSIQLSQASGNEIGASSCTANAETAQALVTLYHLLDHYDDYNKLFGINITPGLRNKLATSLAVPAVSILYRIFRTVVK